MSRRLTCLALWIAFAGLFVASLPNRLAHLDDAWLGEQAFYLARDGVVRSELFHGFLGYEDRIWVFHKLFIPQGAWAIDAFGWSRASLKLVSVPWFLLTLTLLIVAIRRERHLDPRCALWIPLLFVAHPLVVDYAYTFRPELCLSAVGLASYLSLRRYLEDRSPWMLVGSAVLAGVAVLVHLNGVLFIAAGGALLLAERGLRAASGFLVVATAVAALYVADAVLAGELPTLLAQFTNDPALEARDFRFLGLLSKLLDEPQRWYRHGEDLVLSLLVLVSLFAAGASLRREHRRLALYTAVAWVALGLVAQSKTPKYALPLFPLLFLLVGAGLSRALDRKPSARIGARIITGVLILFLVTCASRSWHYFKHNADEPARHAQLLAGIEPGALVAADLTFVFDEIERIRLRGLWSYRVAAEGRGETLDLAGLVASARADGVRHIILDLQRELPRRLAGRWPEGAAGLPVQVRHYEEGNVLVLDLEGADG